MQKLYINSIIFLLKGIVFITVEVYQPARLGHNMLICTRMDPRDFPYKEPRLQDLNLVSEKNLDLLISSLYFRTFIKFFEQLVLITAATYIFTEVNIMVQMYQETSKWFSTPPEIEEEPSVLEIR